MAHDRIKSVPFCMLICALQGRKLSGCLIQLAQFLRVLRCVEMFCKTCWAASVTQIIPDPVRIQTGSALSEQDIYTETYVALHKNGHDSWLDWAPYLHVLVSKAHWNFDQKASDESFWRQASCVCVGVYLSLGTRVVLFSWSYLSYRNCSSYFLHCLVWSFSRRILLPLLLLLLLPLP